jgi:ankyrin repeat protein
MKSILVSIVAAVVLVGCGESQQSAPQAEPVEPIAEASKPEPPTAKAPDISILDAAFEGDIEVVKQHLVAGTNVDAKGDRGMTALHSAANEGYKEIVELLVIYGADVNVFVMGMTPLHYAAGGEGQHYKDIVELLITNGADVNAKEEKYSFVGTPVDWAIRLKEPKIAALLHKHGGKTAEELKAEGK